MILFQIWGLNEPSAIFGSQACWLFVLLDLLTAELGRPQPPLFFVVVVFFCNRFIYTAMHSITLEYPGQQTPGSELESRNQTLG